MHKLDISKLSKKELLGLIQSQELSGLSQKEYCKQHNISSTKFSYWRLRYLKNLKTDNTVNFEEVKLSKPLSIQMDINSCNLKLELADLSRFKLFLKMLKELDA